MIEIISWIILGALAGWIASMIMKTDAEQGAVGNIVVGILGAIIGGFIVKATTDSAGVTGFNLKSLAIAVLGAVILLAIVKAVRRTPHRP